MNPYKHADRRMARVERQIAAEFHNLAVRFPLDRLNVTAARRYVRAMYRRMDKRNREAYILAAIEVYAEQSGKALSRTDAEKLVDRALKAYDPVTEYVYTKETPRKAERTVESMRASESRAQLREGIARARRLWTGQAKQYADEITDAAMLAAYRDAGIKRVRWITQEDERRCGYCLSLDRKEFPINDIPPKPHPNCRCCVEPVT